MEQKMAVLSRRIVLIFAGVTALAAIGVVMAAVLPASAETLTDSTGKMATITGYHTSNSTWSGVIASVDGDSFNPNGGHCVLYSVLSTDGGGQHVEAGLIRCPAGDYATNNPSCTNTVFVETEHNGSFVCHVYASFSNDVYYRFKIQNTTGSTWQAFLYASETPAASTGGFGSYVNLWAWGEHTGGTGCSNWSPAVGRFQNLEKQGSAGWSYVGGFADDPPDCWTLGSMSGTGDFIVTK